MSEQIINRVREHDLLRSESFVNESSTDIQSALERTAALVVNTFAELAEAPSGRELLWNMARETNEVGAPDARATTLAVPRAAELVKSVLDDRYHGTVHALASSAGVQAATVIRLVEVVAAAAVDIMAGLVAEHRWNAPELGEWLRKQQVSAAVASPLAVAAARAVAIHADAPTSGKNGVAQWLSRHSNALLITAGFLAAAEGGYLFGTRSRAEDALVSQTSGDGAVNESASSNRTGSGGFAAMPVANLSNAAPTAVSRKPATVPVVLKLKNGLRQVIGANSTESKLYQFLIDPAEQVDLVDPTKGWIGFDRIYFDTNKATLTNESLWQLSNVASILKRFPAAKIKLGGYTDSTGAPLRNLQLSQARAKAAMESLVSLGVSADRLTAVGYGALDNLASNATEEGRAINRRVSLQVTEK